ncbi:L,D-transpeptidase [Microvirga calopogonii]|uniref:L,D-transpeptidase n=1 Tax=Microvirga calopogonii TaxID=2078013 RepID=UPI003CCAC132
MSLSLTRRTLLAGLPLSLTACVSAGRSPPSKPAVDPGVAAMYTALTDEPHLVPVVDVSRVPPQYVRQVVAFQGPEQPGSIVVDPSRRFLYLVQENGTALRYGCGVGKAGFDYQGSAVVGRKAAWPRAGRPRPT